MAEGVEVMPTGEPPRMYTMMEMFGVQAERDQHKAQRDKLAAALRELRATFSTEQDQQLYYDEIAAADEALAEEKP